MSSTGSPRAVGFDYGRTLVEIGYPAEGLAKAGVELLRMLGVPPPAEITADQVGRAVDTRVDELVARAHARDPVHEVEIYSLYSQALEATLGVRASPDQLRQAGDLLQRPWREAITVDREVGPALTALRRRGVLLGLLSNAPYQPQMMRGMLAEQGLGDCFDVILFSSEIGVRKPAPEAFTALLSELGIKASESWYVGDELEADIEGARAAGMLPLLAPRAGLPERARELGAEALISWAELVARWDSASVPR
ncbi:MAG: HAD family hydrolase [Candidatus Dormibacteria bacterium]